MNKAVDLIDVTKVYNLGGELRIQALRGVDLTVEKGELVSIMGPSGCGKSTLLNIIGGLDNPSDGRVIIDGINITNMDEGKLAAFRSERIGFVFQFFNLVPMLTALENVKLPMVFAERLSPVKMMKRAVRLLSLVGLGERLHHLPNQLSGGQQQRVAMARALANEPSLVIADEPTGNLDSEGGLKIMHFIQHLNETMDQTFILVTHDSNVAKMTQRVIHMLDGRVIETTQPSGEAATKQAASQAQRELLLAELEWLRKSLRLEEMRIEKEPEAYNEAVTEYVSRWKRLKLSLRELGLEA